MTLAESVRTSRARAEPVQVLEGRGWDLYLVAVAALSPFVRGIAGTPLAWPDLLNVSGLLVFAGVVLANRLRFEVPMLLPVLLATAGSLLAVADAVSLPACALALAQDAYLYLWALALIALLRRRGEMLAVRRVAAAATVFVALACVVENGMHGARGLVKLLAPTGYRSLGTLGNANYSAAYLMLGAFTLVGLEHRLPRALVVAGVALVVTGILTTKSNGALIALAAGLTTWALWRAHARGVPARRLAGAASLVAATLLLSAWLVSETGFGGAWLRSVREHSVLGRLERSSASRGRIWERLEGRMTEHPLGIGPGNSSAGLVEIGERERKGSLQSKEAHSDYLGYAVERGPLGFAGLLAALAVLGARVLRSRRALDARAGDPRRGAAMHAACVGALVALLIQSTVVEQLHFRHVWWFVAWMWAATGSSSVPGAERAMPAHALDDATAPSGAPA
jgi:O-antigen ligase